MKLVLSFFLCLSASILSANPSEAFYFSPQLTSAYTELLKLKTVRASGIIAANLQKKPADGIAIYLENYIDFIHLLISEDENLYKQISDNEHLRLDKLRNLDKNSPYFLFTQAEIRLQWAMVKLRFGDNLGAARGFQKSYKLLKENEEKFPDFLPNKKTLGLLYVVLGAVPEKYHWLLNVFGLAGDTSKGWQYLKAASENANPFQAEATLMYQLLRIYLLEETEKPLAELKQMTLQSPDNLLFVTLYAMSSVKNSHSEEALSTLLNCPKSDEYVHVNFLEYLQAEIYLQKNDYSQALLHYYKFLQFHKGKNLKKDAYYKIFLANWLSSQNWQKNVHYLKKVQEVGQTLVEADKYAEKFARTHEILDVNLMKARLAFDGGYYEEGLKMCGNFVVSEKNPKHNAEFFYRKGRIYHKINEIQKAIDLYKQAVKLSEVENYYFGANAALQLAYIYKVRNDKIHARLYFEKALSFKNHEYKNSIDSKAKSGLKDLK
ncbi:MAG: hypothetical protein H7Y04_13280 [Verrucomicrobia bacterium]|nr:hypothetical protein [Cytophagales bacterium]